ncbi:putative 4-nitrophenylphosphatase [Neospora caninum Liverpool]|uniref:4-nitrophenylphosphatase, putative n=1 Tax=Neospora caninum (strain Liverpool) TaxID=572307 RepID=F0VC33_NEOCL|nr:putative 4-nitrophenylphosphatase [Neospora caninum Liverpool]CBZ51167.1 putative 4-nitrophenylphosphatase [Neospora caninum Liverpool]CEL68478.1 TPA: 4-nitrophenylphosphatase, putative [Neospora caninum Liverpool]|eukprot:XP_003881200.1 putative 4-nitrophenylphosphatase [Neospora caninum Liverpool]
MSAAVKDPACGVAAARSLGSILSHDETASGPGSGSASRPLHSSAGPDTPQCQSRSKAGCLALTQRGAIPGSSACEVSTAYGERNRDARSGLCRECATRVADGCCARCGRECVAEACGGATPSAKRARTELFLAEKGAARASVDPCSTNGASSSPSRLSAKALVASPAKSGDSSVPQDSSTPARVFPSWWLQQREHLLDQQRRLASSLPSIHPAAFVDQQQDSLDALTRHGYRVIAGSASDPLADFVDRYDTFLFDVDGVLVMGGQQFAGAPSALQALRQKGKRVIFFTNGASKSRRTCVALLRKAGFEAREEEMICTSYAAAQYMRLTHPHVEKVMVIGEKGLQEEFEAAGMAAVTADAHALAPGSAAPSPLAISSERDFLNMAQALDPSVGAVVVGWDRQLSYAKLCLASLYLQRDNGALPFIAANRDAYDVIGGAKMPANGAAVAALELCSSRQAVCVGKPSPWLVQFLFNKFNLDPRRTIVCGDRLDTDIAFGKCAGIDTCLVLTGCTTVEDLVGMPANHASAPTVVLPHVGVLQTLKYADPERDRVDVTTAESGGN